MSKEKIQYDGETPFFHPFPEAIDVFSGDFAKHEAHFLPLATIDLSHINPDWNGLIPIVTPMEPAVSGVVGEDVPQHHNYLCRDNWIGYHLLEGKVEYAGDWRLFDRQTHEEYYEATQAGYNKAKAYFKEHGCLHSYYGEFRSNGEPSKKVRGELTEPLAWLGEGAARSALGCGLVVFYDREKQLVLTTFNWT